MKSKLDEGIIEGSELMSRGYALLGENIGKWIAVLTALLALLLTFADVDFLGVGTTELTTSIAVMLISSYVIYFSLLGAGERLGRDDEKFGSAEAAWLQARERVGGEMLPSLRQFCLDYIKKELAFRRRALLLEGGLGEEEYEAWLAGEKMPKEATRLFKRAKRLKPIALTPALLLSGSKGNASETAPPGRARLISSILRLIPTTACALFTASMAITAKDGLDAGAIIEGIVKLGCLPIIGLRGYIDGYNYASDRESAWNQARARHLEAFLATQTTPPTLIGTEREGGEAD
jgi:hypothetical protein